MATKKPKVGRPSQYDDSFSISFAELGRKLALLGAKDTEIAAVFGISLSTLSLWKTKHPEFMNALKEGKEQADASVAASLFHRALGYSHPEVDIKVVDKRIVQTPITKHYPPDTTAAIFWLKNRQPAMWRDKVETGITDKDGNDVIPADPKEVVRRLAFMLSKEATQEGGQDAGPQVH